MLQLCLIYRESIIMLYTCCDQRRNAGGALKLNIWFGSDKRRVSVVQTLRKKKEFLSSRVVDKKHRICFYLPQQGLAGRIRGQNSRPEWGLFLKPLLPPVTVRLHSWACYHPLVLPCMLEGPASLQEKTCLESLKGFVALSDSPMLIFVCEANSWQIRQLLIRVIWEKKVIRC